MCSTGLLNMKLPDVLLYKTVTGIYVYNYVKLYMTRYDLQMCAFYNVIPVI